MPTANASSLPSFSFTPHTQRLAIRAALAFLGVLILRALFFSGPSQTAEIQGHGVLERVLMTDKYLDVSKYPFLQNRQGRDNRPDLFDMEVRDGILDFWTRFQKPFITGKETAHLDTQIMRTVVDDLLKFNGWVAAACPNLVRPFGQSDHYEDLAAKDHLYYIAIVIHSADHFLVDQLAIIVQLARRLGTRNIFVSMLDTASNDATPTLSDLCEAVMTILGIAFRIKRVPPMTEDPAATYYPLEEAESRNLALEPLHELKNKRSIKFHRVIWLKGFTCPNDVLESLRVSEVNNAAMVCGMDWAEHNGFFIFSDRYVHTPRYLAPRPSLMSDGEHETLKETCSDKPSLARNPRLALPVTRSVPSDSRTTCRSRYTAASLALTSSTPSSPTTETFRTALPPSLTTCRRRSSNPTGTRTPSAWTRRRCGSAATCGLMLRRTG